MNLVRLSRSLTLILLIPIVSSLIKISLFDILKCMNVNSGVCVILSDALAETSLLALCRSVCLPSVSHIPIDDHG